MSDVLPPLGGGRGHLATEGRLAASADLDTLSIPETLALINDEDARVAAAVRRALPALAGLVAAAVAAFAAGGRLIYVGAGTSGRLGVLDASECPPTFHSDPAQVVGIIAGGDAALRRSAEGAEDDPHAAGHELARLGVGPTDVVVGIAAGGTTPYVWGAIRAARERGAATGMITCVALEGLPAMRAYGRPDHAVELLVGAEVVTGSTRMKAGTATKLALNMLTTAAMAQSGKTWGHLMVDLRASNAKLVDRALRILMGQTGLGRDEAMALLGAAGGRVKTALVMALRGVGAEEAHRLIDAHGGRLRALLGPPR